MLWRMVSQHSVAIWLQSIEIFFPLQPHYCDTNLLKILSPSTLPLKISFALIRGEDLISFVVSQSNTTKEWAHVNNQCGCLSIILSL